MKRDMDLVRKILFLAEEDKDARELYNEFGQEQVAGHIAILIDAGFIEGAVSPNSDGKPIVGDIVRLTWAGHEFLDNARNDTVWNEAKNIVKKKCISVSFDIVSSLLKSIISSSVGL